MKLPPFLDELHGQLGFYAGLPVYEDPLVPPPGIIVEVPLVWGGGSGLRRQKLIVPSWKRLQDELWIETSLHQAVRENMGDTLRWLYGDAMAEGYVSPSSTYSLLLLRRSTEENRQAKALMDRWQEFVLNFRISAHTTPPVSPKADGLFGILGI